MMYVLAGLHLFEWHKYLGQIPRDQAQELNK